MKKMFVAVFAVMSCFTISSENAGETDIHGHSIHNHAYAAGYGDIKWQCNKCGLQDQYRGPSSSRY